MKPKVKEIACLCGARERDTGQERPRPCWNCGDKMGMGKFGGRVIAKVEGRK